MKKRLPLLLCLLLCLLCACSPGRSSEPAPTPAPTPVPTPEPTPEPTPPPVEISGKSFAWDTETIDLSSASPCRADELADALLALPELRELDLTGWPLTDEEQFRLLRDYPGISFRWDVELFGMTVNSADELVCLDGIAMEDTTALEEKLPLLAAVRRFDMCDCGPDDEAMYALTQRWPDHRFVWKAHIGTFTFRTDITSFCMNTVGAKIHATSDGLNEQMRYFPDLIAVDFGHSGLNITDLEWVKWLPHLQILIAIGCDIRDLTPLAELKELTYLELFTNRYLVDISPLAGCTALQDLNLSLTDVADLTPLYGLENLNRLWVNGCRKLTAEEVDAFYYAMPDCRISFILNSTGALNGWRLDDRYFWMRDVFEAYYMPVTSELMYGMKQPNYYYPEGEPRKWDLPEE